MKDRKKLQAEGVKAATKGVGNQRKGGKERGLSLTGSLSKGFVCVEEEDRQ